MSARRGCRIWWSGSRRSPTDTLFAEDASRVRTRSGPRVMASLRNLAIGALHLAGLHDTTEATRWAARRAERPFHTLDLT